MTKRELEAIRSAAAAKYAERGHMTKKEELEALTASADRIMTEQERLVAELHHTPVAMPTTVPINAPAFRRKGGVTIRLEAAPPTPTPGVLRLIKGSGPRQ